MSIFTKQTRGGVSERSILIRFLILLAAVILIAGLWGWWHFIYSNPERVFWGMVDNALKTTSFGKTISQDNLGQAIGQEVQTLTQPKQLSIGKNTIRQSGTGGFDVTTDLVGTPTADYVRYKSIKTDQKTADGKAPDYGNIIGVWGKTDTPRNQTAGQLYNQSVLGAIPFGNLSYSQRKELTNFMASQSVYKTDYDSVGRSQKNGRPIYTYKVSINPEAYINMLKKFALFTGLNNLDQTNPADFRTTQPLQFEFDVDVWTREIRAVRYADGRQEHYGGFGAHIYADWPVNAIPIDELQKRIQAVQ